MPLNYRFELSVFGAVCCIGEPFEVTFLHHVLFLAYYVDSRKSTSLLNVFEWQRTKNLKVKNRDEIFLEIDLKLILGLNFTNVCQVCLE